MSDSAANGYNDCLAKACVAALDGQTGGFAELVPQMRGADPAAVLGILDALAQTDTAHARFAARFAADARENTTAEPIAPVPVPHPLDYAWPFSVTAREELLARLQARSNAGEEILYIGAPTLHAAACERLPDRSHVLVDRDPRQTRLAAVPTNARAIQADLLTSPPALEPRAAAAVVDPPWYPAEAVRFLGVAARGLRPGAVLFLSFASELTRPAADSDAETVVAQAIGQGLDLAGRFPAVLRYATPPFEYAALRAAGVACVPPDWRCADLIELGRSSAEPDPLPPTPADEWEAADIGPIPLRVRPGAPPSTDQLLAPLVAGEVLASVSRRDPLREKVALWTARNRVYGSSDPSLLARVAVASSRGRAVPAGDEGEVVASVLRQIATREAVECGVEA